MGIYIGYFAVSLAIFKGLVKCNVYKKNRIPCPVTQTCKKPYLFVQKNEVVVSSVNYPGIVAIVDFDFVQLMREASNS